MLTFECCNVSFIHYVGPFQPFAREIEEQISYTEIEAHLISEGLLTRDQQQILSNTTSTEQYRRRHFCSIVLEYNLENCKKFLKCLKGTSTYSSHEQLYKTLSSTLGEYNTLNHLYYCLKWAIQRICAAAVISNIKFFCPKLCVCMLAFFHSAGQILPC